MKFVTHNSRFHYDELLATAILLRIFPDSSIVRTRSDEIIETGDIVYDVGRICDVSRNRFDHHQGEFTETYSDEYKIKLSSAGLIYKYFHKNFLLTYNITPGSQNYDLLVNKIYKSFILPADAIDNGYNIYTDIVPRTIYSMVDSYNNYEDLFSEEQEKQFYKALELVSKDLDMFMKGIISNWYNNYNELDKLVKDLDDYILVLDKHYGVDLVLDIEKKYNKNILYIIYPGENSTYHTRAVNISETSYTSKKPLKAEWRGKSEEELSKLIDGATFVHSSGFLGVNKTLEGAIKMCRESYAA